MKHYPAIKTKQDKHSMSYSMGLPIIQHAVQTVTGDREHVANRQYTNPETIKARKVLSNTSDLFAAGESHQEWHSEVIKTWMY